jgi:hypothetical protein
VIHHAQLRITFVGFMACFVLVSMTSLEEETFWFPRHAYGEKKGNRRSERDFASDLAASVLSMPKCHTLGYHFLSHSHHKTRAKRVRE